MNTPTTPPEIVITVGYPGSGKGTYVKPLLAAGYQCFNRDTYGGRTARSGSPIYEAALVAFAEGCRHFVFDNTYGRVEARAAVISFSKEVGLPIRCLWLQTTLEQAQLFASRRQVQKYGMLFRKEDYKIHKGDPNMFPPGAQFAYRKQFEPPTLAEGFASIEKVEVETVWGPEYVNKAIFLDLDGTVRYTPDENACPWPRYPSEVIVRPGSGAVLKRKQAEGYLILAVTNQSGVSRKPSDPKHVTEQNVKACIAKTEKDLGIKFDGALYATDRGGPPSTYWRKPCPGMAVVFIEKFKLNPALCECVGDMKTDATFAERAGIPFQWAHKFFKLYP